MASRIHLAAISDRKAFGFESSRHCPWQIPVCPERIFHLASSWILASAYTPAASQSPPPSKVPGLKTSGSTKRSFFRTRFLSPIITGWLYRSSVCISCPNRSHKDRCVRFFALPGDMTFSPREVLPLSFGAPARNIRKSLSRPQRRRGSIFLDVPHRYRPRKDAFLDQDRARKLKPEWEPTDCTVRRRIILPRLHDGGERHDRRVLLELANASGRSKITFKPGSHR